jgi:hypothetical protein
MHAMAGGIGCEERLTTIVRGEAYIKMLKMSQKTPTKRVLFS